MMHMFLKFFACIFLLIGCFFSSIRPGVKNNSRGESCSNVC